MWRAQETADFRRKPQIKTKFSTSHPQSPPPSKVAISEVNNGSTWMNYAPREDSRLPLIGCTPKGRVHAKGVMQQHLS